MISRRDFLRLLPATIAGGYLAGRQGIIAEAQGDASRLYQGANLQGWTVALGDAIYARPGLPPVSLSDIATIHYPTYSELQANIRRRIIMAHNITYKKIVDSTAMNHIHTCSASFRLPYLPVKDENSILNGQSIEGGIFVWDGDSTRLDYGIAFQWGVNPWSEFGKLRVWTDEGGGTWKNVGYLKPDIAWHTLKMIVDYKRHATALLIDGKHILCKFTKTPKDSSWGPTMDARFQLEIVSIYPEPSGMKAKHRALFKNWSWRWEPAG